MKTERTELVVVGAGPVGIAALFEAAREGIDAIGLEAGSSPLANIRSYTEGSVLLSPAHHYEVGGLPLDCRDASECTREELLHYYARVINYGNLDIRCDTQCIELRPHVGGVRVITRSRHLVSAIEATSVVFTSFYRRRRPPRGAGAKTAVLVSNGMRDPTALAKKRVVIVGGGLSAYEHAGSLMMNGQPVTLLVRGLLRSFHMDARFLRLLRATRSRIFDRISDLEVATDSVHFSQKGRQHLVPCDAAVFCIGAELSTSNFGILAKAGVVSSALIRGLARAHAQAERNAALATRYRGDRQSVESAYFDPIGPIEPHARRQRGIGREHPSEPHARAGDPFGPDLWDHLFVGVNGVRLAGASLHHGTSSAGVQMSIKTAALAVRAISGDPPPPGLERPLPRALLDWARNFELTSPTFDRIAPLHPLAIGSWTRNWLPLGLRQGRQTRHGDDEAKKYLLGARSQDQTVRDLVAVADGTSSVRGIARRSGIATVAARAQLANAFYKLWRMNVLTWLPPPAGLPRSDRG